ncbi:unnamed protein product [Alternaria alternata]
MRLLHLEANGFFSLTEFFYDIPPYAILSHTWGDDHEEVSYRDIIKRTGTIKVGYGKLQFCARQAALSNLRYIWVDTACIDKGSSAELSEAINSMYRWYQRASVCYVYLSDITSEGVKSDPRVFQTSRWFTRGWTLQELIAPNTVQFFTAEERYIGDRVSLLQSIVEVTSIPKAVLEGRRDAMNPYKTDVRLSWAKGRQTKREEDAAYCLMGLFDVNMPLLYGEGRERAFRRFRKEVRQLDLDTVQMREEECARHIRCHWLYQVYLNTCL